MKPLEHLEPAERDPVAIRRTVIFLIFVMLLGGFFIVYKYKQKMEEEADERKKGRPAMSLGNVSAKGNFGVKAMDGKVYDFTLLEGRLTLLAVISAKLPEQSQIIVDEMKKAQAHFSEREALQCVCISADKMSDVSLEEMNAFAKRLGIEGENWKFAASDAEAFTGFVKNILKLGLVSRIDKITGEKLLPDFLRIVDPAMRLRGEISDYTFIEYHDDKARAEKILKSNAQESEKKQAQEVYDNILQYQRDRMYKNIDYILTYEKTDVDALKKANRSNKYEFPLFVFGGFIAFILVMGYRLKVQRRKEENR